MATLRHSIAMQRDPPGHCFAALLAGTLLAATLPTYSQAPSLQPVTRQRSIDIFGPADPRPDELCQWVPNGSFSQSFDGWTLEPSTAQTPAAAASTGWNVVNGSLLLVPLDESVARLTATATADGSKAEPGVESAASAELVLSTTAIATDRYLKFTLVGGWEVVFFAAASYALEVEVQVKGPVGQIVTSAIEQFSSMVQYECPTGFAILGVLGLDSPQVVMDLAQDAGAAAPIQIGDALEIRVVVTCSASAADACDYAQVFAVVYVDDFRFCAPETASADLNDDGAVGGADLAMLLAGWGACKAACPADLNDDAAVDGLDLAILLAAWGPAREVSGGGPLVVSQSVAAGVSAASQN